VEKTSNALLDVEADWLCNAQRYERTEARRDTRAGHFSCRGEALARRFLAVAVSIAPRSFAPPGR
jgi:hypothetical protein